MQTEGVVIMVLCISFIAYKVWNIRKTIKELYIAGFNMMCIRFGLPPYIPKEKKDGKRDIN